MSESERYAKWVLEPENEVKTGRFIKQAARRFLRDLERTDIYFDAKESNKFVFFCENHVRQWEGDWQDQPLILEDWQKFIFQQVYGWIRKEDGRRRFNKVYIQVAKKNGKSSICGALANFHIYADDRVNTPKVFTAANNEDQAKICVNIAGRMIEASPDLSCYVDDGTVAIFNYKDNITEVVHREKNGFIKALSKETDDKKAKTAGGKHGINASLGIVDEFGMSPDHGASKAIETSMASRKEYLMFYITTAGYNMDGPCFTELRKLGIDVLDELVVRDNYLPIIYEMDDGDDYKDEKNWTKCNPNLGVSVNKAFLKDMVQDAIQKGGKTEVDIKTLNFNLWLDSPEVFIPSEVWDKNAHGLSEEDLIGAECYGGIEIVSGRLLNAFMFFFPDVNGHQVIRPVFWMPVDMLDKPDNFMKWGKEGLIHEMPGNVVDNDKVYEILLGEIKKYSMHSFAFKTTLETNDIVQSLIKNGIKGDPISHGYSGISTPTTVWEELLTAGTVEHFGNPVLAWMNGNCLCKRKENDVRLEKSGSRIVGIYAGINALAQYKTVAATQSNDQLITSW